MENEMMYSFRSFPTTPGTVSVEYYNGCTWPVWDISTDLIWDEDWNLNDIREIRDIIDRVANKEKESMRIETCHLDLEVKEAKTMIPELTELMEAYNNYFKGQEKQFKEQFPNVYGLLTHLKTVRTDWL